MDTPTLLRTTTGLGILASLILSGIGLGTSHITLPFLYPLAPSTSTPLFTQLYHRGAATIVPLGLFGAFCLGASAYLDPEKRTAYAIAGLATLSQLLWTLVVMMGINQRLLAIAGDGRIREKVDHAEVEGLLRKWKWMNNVRAGMALVGGVVGLCTVMNVL